MGSSYKSRIAVSSLAALQLCHLRDLLRGIRILLLLLALGLQIKIKRFKMVSACRTPETMIPKLMVTCSILFVMSCFILSFAWYTNSSNTACLGPAAHLAWQTFAQRVRDHWDFHNVTDPATREGWIQGSFNIIQLCPCFCHHLCLHYHVDFSVRIS